MGKHAKSQKPEALKLRILGKIERGESLNVGERLWLKAHMTPSELTSFLWEGAIRNVLKKY